MAGPTEPARRDGRLTGVVTDTTALTPEARAHLRKGARHQLAKLKPGPAAIEVVKRAGLGVFNDGFIHAGNLAYLALMTVFPFFITAAAVLSLLGQSAETQRAVSSFLHVLPPNVADILRKPIADVLVARTGSLLWLGGLVGLWTVGSFVETIRDIFHRAYGVKASVPFWRSRLSSSGRCLDRGRSPRRANRGRSRSHRPKCAATGLRRRAHRARCARARHDTPRPRGCRRPPRYTSW